jgi:hypothetical protein
MKRVLLLALLLGGCASTAMKGFMGQPIEEAFFRYGKPVNTIDLPDGAKAFQFYWGGSGPIMVPAQSRTNVTTYGNTATLNTVATPAAIFESQGCLVTLIARPENGRMVVREYRIPKRLVC